MRQIILDTETTGLEVSDGNRIIEIGCVELLNRQLTGNNLHLYINPERESEEGALRVHGLTTEFLRDKPRFAEIVQQFLDYVQGAEVIIHNAAFDVRFLDYELSLLQRHEGFRSHVANVIDSLALAKEQFPGKRNSLDALCDRFGIDNSNRTLHGALLDAELLADVYISLTRGQETLVMYAEQADDTGTGTAVAQVDLSQIVLPVLRANAAEQDAHAAMLAVLDKASGGNTIWKKSSDDLQNT